MILTSSNINRELPYILAYSINKKVYLLFNKSFIIGVNRYINICFSISVAEKKTFE